jgi:hypothetical protein
VVHPRPLAADGLELGRRGLGSRAEPCDERLPALFFADPEDAFGDHRARVRN